ncbi:TonB-dependent receptor [Gammaproteobacteria bacterium]|nr:TonB-dependent receptor [Gammaproteobacteria bacterium]MDB2448431.1 TonB-dependent receptor [Gammaproteobacteria bacterium]MDC1073684.1 TonB-dependent receptor [Gammaproteobacteria bacterium]
MKKLLSTLIIFSATYSNEIASQDVEEIIVVTSALIDTTEITNPLYVIDGDEILDDATTSLGDAIDSYLGISIADYGAAVGQPIIRGMSGPRVKILKNGMVIRDVSAIGADHINDIDLNDIEQIEIVKGPSSLLYANGTIGGIINVVDDSISTINYELPKLKVGYETQSVNDGSSEFINFKNNFNGFNVNVGYKNTEFGNYDVPDGAVIHEEDHGDDKELSYIENSDYAVEATKFGISRAGDWGYVGVSVDNLESLYGIPFHGEEHPKEDGEPHEDERIFSSTDSESFTVKGSYNVNGNLVNKIDYTYRDSDYTLVEAHAEEEGHDEPHDPEEEEHAPTLFSNNATEYGAIFDISNDIKTQKLSFNYVDEDSSIVGEEAFMNPANNEVLTLGYFVGQDFDMFHVDLGIRLDQVTRTGSVTDEDHGDVDNFTIDDDVSSFAVSIGRDLSDTLELNLGFSSAERLPSVIELFMNGPHMASGRFEVGDPTLSAETSNNFDISLNFDNGEYFASASFFINDVDNYIALIDEEDHDGHDPHGGDDDGDDPHDGDDDGQHPPHDGDDDGQHPPHDPHENLIHANYVQEDAEFDGYEIEFGRTFDLGAGEMTLSFGRDLVNAQFTDGHNVPRINPARNVYSLSYAQDDIVFKLHLKDVEKQNDVGEGETATAGYQMLDTRLTKTFDLSGKGELKVSLFGRNLLDEAARNHASFVKNEVPLPGKNYGIKFNLTY